MNARNETTFPAELSLHLRCGAREPGAAPAPSRAIETVRLLVVDPDTASRDRIRRLCAESRMIEVSLAASIEEANNCELAADGVLFDFAAAPSPEALREALDRLDIRRERSVGLAITSPNEDLELRMAAAHAGADTFMIKPLSRHSLQETVRLLWRKTHAAKKRVLLIDDDPDFLALAEQMLSTAGYTVVGMTGYEPLLDNLRNLRPDAILIDLGMPRYDGIALTTMLRNSSEFDNTVVLFLSGHDDPLSIRAAFAAGADDFLVKPVRAVDLILRLEARIERARRRQGAAEREPLTGLLTRGPFLAALENRIASGARNGTQTTVAMLDLDLFKRVNDRHGHAVGDQVLAAFGQLLRTEFRDEDLKCRWGGEEFVLAFPQGQPIEITHQLIERLLLRFKSLQFAGAEGQRFSMSFSAGIAQMSATLADMDELIDLADQRLFTAKRRGRSLVISSS